MEEVKFRQILDSVNADVSNRSNGSFKRALWYGGKKFGGQTGVRKNIRNTPRMLLTAGVGQLPIPPGISHVVDVVVDKAMDFGKDQYSQHIKPRIKSKRPMSADEALRKNVKKSVKEMKGNAFQVIDRNLVKLKDAKNKIDPAVQALMKTQATSQGVGGFGVNGVSSEAEQKSAHDALKAIVETQYYLDKVVGLITATRDSCDQLIPDLEKIKIGVEKKQEDVSNYIKEYLS